MKMKLEPLSIWGEGYLIQRRWNFDPPGPHNSFFQKKTCHSKYFVTYTYTPKIPAIKSYKGHYLVPNWQHITVKMGFYMNDIIRKYIWSEILSAIDDVNHSIQTGLKKIAKHITLPGI